MKKYTQKDFLNLILDNKPTCFSPNKYGTTIKLNPEENDVFFSINLINPNIDLNPTEKYHSKYKPRRADHNVIEYRNFLIELDNMELETQIEYVRSKIPVSSIVYSGGKSYHFILSLEDPPETAQEYTILAKRIEILIPEMDRHCKNPSRLSRLPCVIRPDTEKEQALIYLGTRFKLSEIDKILPKYEKKQYSKFKTSPGYVSVKIASAISNPQEAMADMNIDSRNLLFFWLGKRLEELNINMEKRYDMVEQMYANLINKNDFKIEEAYTAARIK